MRMTERATLSARMLAWEVLRRRGPQESPLKGMAAKVDDASATGSKA